MTSRCPAGPSPQPWAREARAAPEVTSRSPTGPHAGSQARSRRGSHGPKFQTARNPCNYKESAGGLAGEIFSYAVTVGWGSEA